MNDVDVSAADLIPCATTTNGSYTLEAGAVINEAECRSILAQDPFAGTALGLIPTPSGETAGQAVNPSVVLTGQPQEPWETITLPASPNTRALDWQTGSQNSYSYSSTSEMQTSVTNIEGNSLAITASANVNFEGFGAGASDTLTVGSTTTAGITLDTTYKGSNSTTTGQNADTTATLSDTQNPLSVATYVDQRFSTFMFQSPEGTGASPSVTGVSPGGLALTVPGGLSGKLKGDGAFLTVSTPHESLPANETLVLPGGQKLVTSVASPSDDATVLVRNAKITTPVAPGGSVTVPGYVTVTGSGFYGPLQVSFCSNITSVPQCTATDSVFSSGTSGTTLYAPAPSGQSGSNIAVIVQSQSGLSPNWAYQTGTGTSLPTITKFKPAKGKPGTKVTITGTNLAGATALAFNGTPATITTDSATKITTTVPAGATTGDVQVTTGGGTVTSTKPFTVS
jgi:hypothetical protein